MHVLVTCKNEDDRIKNERASVHKIYPNYKSLGIFPDAQGQLTPQLLVKSGPNSNLSEILWLSSFPGRMKKIRSKMKALACSQHFAHYNPMGAIACHGNQSSKPIWPQTYYSISPYPMMLQMKFGCNRPTGLRDIHV